MAHILIGFGGGDVNLYAYVQNNPVNLTDPLGLLTGGEGLDVTGSLTGWGGTANAQFVWDPNGDVGVAFTYGGGGYSEVAGISSQGTWGGTSANSINDLGGPSATVGGGVSYPPLPGLGWVATSEQVIASSYMGTYVSGGYGAGYVPVEQFGMLKNTKVINFTDLMEIIIHKLAGLPIPGDNMYK